MTDLTEGDDVAKRPSSGSRGRIVRAALTTAGGAIPFAGGIVSAVAGDWSEREQERANQFFENYLDMLRDELKEKGETVVDILARLDLQDEGIASRVESLEFQSLMKKTFRDWAGAESELKRSYIRNILANAASTDVSSDDVVRMFIDWLRNYSEMHFQVIAAIYNTGGIGRGEIWEKIGKPAVREDSADADLYKLLIRDLSMGSIIRQERETDRAGNFMKKRSTKKRSGGSREMKSAFDNSELYVLTSLGQDFVHYAMTDIPLKIEFDDTTEN
ncbi:hypothetical protein N9850_11060 [Granulosicoccus sp.]|nr:hypothetical protein [Granulosicoccus sp.]MDB4224303.1 hypothetical protein [Granulosicoccus sp.]